MKNLSHARNRRRVISLSMIAGVVVAIALIYVFTKAEPTKLPPSSYTEYISAYTNGIIARSSTIKVRFAKDIINEEKIGENAEQDIISFSPNIDGKLVWSDKRTIEFLPSDLLPSGAKYEAKLNLEKIFKENIPDSLKTFYFDFGTIKQSYEVSIDRIELSVTNNQPSYTLKGRFIFADIADSSSLINLISARFDGEKIPVKVSYNPNAVEHQFLIESISRNENASALIIEYKNSSLNADKLRKETIIIPAIDEFAVMRIKVNNGNNKFISVEFSDVLSQENNFDGLVSLENIAGIQTIVDQNELHIYPPMDYSGETVLQLFPGLTSDNGKVMEEMFERQVTFEETKPSVRFTREGTILPSTKGWILPFDAVNLDRVDVRVIKIFENNIPQFLQENDLSDDYYPYNLTYVGRPVLAKTIKLGDRTDKKLNAWNRYTLDLTKLIQAEPGAIYQVRIGFKKQYSVYPCGDELAGNEDPSSEEDNGSIDKYNGYEQSFWDYYDDYYFYDEDYNWEERDDPCKSSYYTPDRFITKNILASDLGLLAKIGSNGDFLAVATDLLTTKPIDGVNIKIYDFQRQLITSGKTGSGGLFKDRLIRKPFLMCAEYKKQRGYLKLLDGNALSLSNFDAEGQEVKSGLKGFIYGERGVWRPGDSLYLMFILEDKEKSLPCNHPAVLELFNPRHQLCKRIVKTENIEGFYDFRTCTEPDALTGNWQAKIKLGGTEFTKTLKIETVKPNRLKINLDFGTDKITPANNNLRCELSAKWLHGANAGSLRADLSYVLTKGKTEFAGFKDYAFEDPSLFVNGESQELFRGNLDETGKAMISINLKSKDAPGVLAAHFNTKVFEPGGAFSIDRFSIPFYPYESYVGIRVPKEEKSQGMLFTNKNYKIDFVVVDYNGKKVSKDKIIISLYKLNWRWWWDQSEDYQLNYITSSSADLLSIDTISAKQGKGAWNLKIDYQNWGRYLIRALDPVSGHTSGQVVYLDWPDWTGKGQKNFPGGAAMLSIETDKDSYKTGETVKVKIPSSQGGRAFVSIENGITTIDNFWVETTSGETKLSFEAKPSMAPNVYLHISLLQQHSQTINDLPIRLYGIVPLTIDNPNTHLSPKILMPESLVPEQNVTVKVKEEKAKPMTYTLAIVDEGLLDLTRFKTPDPWNNFYAREALGVKTWDLFEDVIGAYGGRLDRLFAIGGDAAGVLKRPAKANRFTPVVKFFGPFHLPAGKTASHTFKMPNYVGAVRVMVVAAKDGSYGNDEKTVTVKKPLMAIGTLPRTLTPGDEIDLPVTIFAMEKKVKNVNIRLNTSVNVKILGSNQQNLNFATTGEKTVNFRIKILENPGIANFTINASSGSEKSYYKIEADIRCPNPPVTEVIDKIIEPGKKWNVDYLPVGMKGTNYATLELSSIPPLNLGKRLNFLIQYPYGCLEQTISSAFPQLYLSNLMKLDKNRSEKIDRNIKATISKLQQFQTASGGFAFWEGGNQINDWATSYAGHFLIEVKEKGYFVPELMLRKWKDYQNSEAIKWNINGTSSDLAQAYRLYTLALNNTAQTGAMNRMRETPKLSTEAKWRLAAAYAVAGYKDVAEKIVKSSSTVLKGGDYRYTFGSDLRDKAMILETVSILGKRKLGVELMKSISSALSNDMWLSTQTISYCLIAAAKFSGNTSADFSFTYKFKGEAAKSLKSIEHMFQTIAPINIVGGNSVEVKNDGKGIIYARLVLEGIPAIDERKYLKNNLSMNIDYIGIDGKNLDPSNIAQGTDFFVVVSVSNPGLAGNYENLALSQMFPSGWEILAEHPASSMLVKSSLFDYRDVRDDRVYTYFNLRAGETKSFVTALNASYSGEFYMPMVICEEMYNGSINARIPGKKINVRMLKGT